MCVPSFCAKLAPKRHRCHRVAEATRIPSVGDHAAKLAKSDPDRSTSKRHLPGAFAHIVMIALKPAARDTEPIGHLMEFMICVSDHMKHDHAAVPCCHVVDIDGHDYAATPTCWPAAILH